MCLEGTLQQNEEWLKGLGWRWEMEHGANQRKEMQILLQVSRAREEEIDQKYWQSVGRTSLLNVRVKREGGLEQ